MPFSYFLLGILLFTVTSYETKWFHNSESGGFESCSFVGKDTLWTGTVGKSYDQHGHDVAYAFSTENCDAILSFPVYFYQVAASRNSDVLASIDIQERRTGENAINTISRITLSVWKGIEKDKKPDYTAIIQPNLQIRGLQVTDDGKKILILAETFDFEESRVVFLVYNTSSSNPEWVWKSVDYSPNATDVSTDLGLSGTAAVFRYEVFNNVEIVNNLIMIYDIEKGSIMEVVDYGEGNENGNMHVSASPDGITVPDGSGEVDVFVKGGKSYEWVATIDLFNPDECNMDYSIVSKDNMMFFAEECRSGAQNGEEYWLRVQKWDVGPKNYWTFDTPRTKNWVQTTSIALQGDILAVGLREMGNDETATIYTFDVTKTKGDPLDKITTQKLMKRVDCIDLLIGDGSYYLLAGGYMSEDAKNGTLTLIQSRF